MTHQIFISYSQEDRMVADRICTALEAANINCWIAPRDIMPGLDWGEAIIDAISSSKAMLLVFSARSNKSQQVKREVQNAIADGVAVLPVKIDSTAPNKSMRYFIGTQQWWDAVANPMETHLRELVEAVSSLVARAPKEYPAQSVVQAVQHSDAPAKQLGSGLELCGTCGNKLQLTYVGSTAYCEKCGAVYQGSGVKQSDSSAVQSSNGQDVCEACGNKLQLTYIGNMAYCETCGVAYHDRKQS